MDSAFRISRRSSANSSLFEQAISASEVRSREDARKLAPFVDASKRRMVYWRRSSFDAASGKCTRRSHFVHFPKRKENNYSSNSIIDFDGVEKLKHASSIHTLVRDTIANVLQEMLKKGEPLTWCFRDRRQSDFSFSGNLLEGVISVEKEYRFQTPFNKEYRFDIALVGPKMGRQPIVLGAIEIELSHEFELEKCLLCKSLGFPLFSIDISGVNDNDICPKMCIDWLISTTANNPDGRRENYIYLHEALYPIYTDAPKHLFKENRHQYIVFVPDNEFEKTFKWLIALKEQSDISHKHKNIIVQEVNARNAQAQKTMESEGSIAGFNWSEFNTTRYIRIVSDRPVEKSGALYFFHLRLARMLNAHVTALVGYKYQSGARNDRPEEDLWQAFCEKKRVKFRLLPKQVTQPVQIIIDELNRLTK